MKWTGEHGLYKFTITKEGDKFDLEVNRLGDKFPFWFPSYQSARRFLKREYYFDGRMKKSND